MTYQEKLGFNLSSTFRNILASLLIDQSSLIFTSQSDFVDTLSLSKELYPTPLQTRIEELSLPDTYFLDDILTDLSDLTLTNFSDFTYYLSLILEQRQTELIQMFEDFRTFY